MNQSSHHLYETVGERNKCESRTRTTPLRYPRRCLPHDMSQNRNIQQCCGLGKCQSKRAAPAYTYPPKHASTNFLGQTVRRVLSGPSSLQVLQKRIRRTRRRRPQRYPHNYFLPIYEYHSTCFPPIFVVIIGMSTASLQLKVFIR